MEVKVAAFQVLFADCWHEAFCGVSSSLEVKFELRKIKGPNIDPKHQGYLL